MLRADLSFCIDIRDVMRFLQYTALVGSRFFFFFFYFFCLFGLLSKDMEPATPLITLLIKMKILLTNVIDGEASYARKRVVST